MPLSADFDGDSKADLVVYRPSTGEWLVKSSVNNYSDSTTYQWGLPGDLPIAGDFDGDGRTDLVVFRPSHVDVVLCGFRRSSSATRRGRRFNGE